MGTDDGAVDCNGRGNGADDAGGVGVRAPKRPREGQEDGVSALPDTLVLNCPRVAAAATEIADMISRTKRGARTARAADRDLRALIEAEVCAREIVGTDCAYVQLAHCHPVQLAPLLEILARHTGVRASVHADSARLVLAPGEPFGELPQKTATFERALAAACRTPAATLRTTRVSYLAKDFDQILAPASVPALPLANLLNYRDVLKAAWIIVDDGVGLLRRVN